MSTRSPNPSTDLPFTPRKEFIREQSQAPNSFALLALSSSNCIRLYSFGPPVISSLRRLFEQLSIILSSREDSEQSLCEFSLDGKPWANPKSVATEKLLLDIIAVIYQCGYGYLSTIDYGREADDRLAMAFSKSGALSSSTSRTPTPLPPSMAAHQDSSGSSLGEKSKSKRVPFALSFASATVMRVIAPPLHLTPAILQAVRGSWPRGVVSEKKVGDNSFEFKLKGYKWFQQDTFATDSLRHILSLLSSLDSHSFSLLTSISLTNRSRVKDLWIFTGPAPERPETPEQTLLGSAFADMKRIPSTGISSDSHHATDIQPQHRRLATEPSPAIPHSPLVQHSRSATDSPQRQQYTPVQSPQPHVLRKPAPRAQVPISVVRDSDIPEEHQLEQQQPEHHPVRAYMPSTISTEADNMTGVGAIGHSPDVFYATSPFDVAGSHLNYSPPKVIPVSPQPRNASPASLGRSPMRPVSDRIKTPPLLVSSSPPSSPRRMPPSPSPSELKKEQTDSFMTSQPLLGMGTFRDSAFSSHSELSCDIPIKWTGPLKDELKPEQEKQKAKPSRISSSPMLPGGWQPTPIEEKSEDDAGVFGSPSEEKSASLTPIHENNSRIEAPALVTPDMSLRKSEAALVGLITSTSHTPPVPERVNAVRKESQNSVGGGGQGWVLVNVEGSKSPTPVLGHEAVASGEAPAIVQSPEPQLGGSPLAKDISTPSDSQIPLTEQASPAAKAIVIIDAMESKHKKSRSTQLKDNGEGRTAVKRFFSLSKKNSKKTLDEDKQVDGDIAAATSIPRSNLRDRLRLIGTPEASRREGKRRSID
ncbi:hypothetical protein B0H34DRAFT_38332 [Crassisporium funariophilum]|nr:hypothetical protein B0H34DRAFT_38332 [Crassisporium funariophilum]